MSPEERDESAGGGGARVTGTVHVRAGKSKPSGIALVFFAIVAIALFALAFVLAFAALVAGVVLIGGAIALFAFRRATGRLATSEEIAARHGVTPRDIDRLLEQHQITPNVVINGRPLYDPRALKGLSRLLRAAGGPIVDAELLRPAGSAAREDRRLLRAETDSAANADASNSVEESTPSASSPTID